jgi:hypothetical protein
VPVLIIEQVSEAVTICICIREVSHSNLDRLLAIPENRVVRGIFEPKREEVAGVWRRLHNEELRLVGHVERMGDMKNHTKFFGGKPEGK